MEEAPGHDRTYELYFVCDDSWTETGITWNNQPTYNSPFLDEVSTGIAGGITPKWGKNGINPLTENLRSQASTGAYSRSNNFSPP